MIGFDMKNEYWRTSIPIKLSTQTPNYDVLMKSVVAGHHSLICLNMDEMVYIFNPMTGGAKLLPPLNHPRHPIVLSLQVTTPGRADFRVIAVGSAVGGTAYLSRKTEVFCSVKEQWKVVGDVPGEDFIIIEHQTGVCCEKQNLLLCTGFMEVRRKGILAFDLGKNEWRPDSCCPISRSRFMNSAVTTNFRIAQLVKSDDGVIYLFSEQATGSVVTQCIERLDFRIGGTHTRTRALTRFRPKTRGLLLYPDYTCLPLEENKLCIFNTVGLTGDVYDMSKKAVGITLNPYRHLLHSVTKLF